MSGSEHVQVAKVLVANKSGSEHIGCEQEGRESTINPYFRPPKTLPYKNLDTLNFAAVGVSLFSAGTALLGSVFLLAV